MPFNIKDLYGSKLAAKDGLIGSIKDFYFDDKTWVIRYLIADTGSWLAGRLVLISPHAFGRFDREAGRLSVNLTRAQIEGSPPIESHRPVSRQYEIEYYRYYGWPAYWDGGALWGLGGYPMVPPSRGELDKQIKLKHREDKHLQSTLSVNRFQVQASDGVSGFVSAFMLDDRSWAICDIVVEAGHWYSGREVLVSTAAVERISYEDSTVFINLTRDDIRRTAENQVAVSGS
jgi:hypothetical protein